MTRLHPMRLLMRLGISDGPAATAIIITICLQYIFLAKLWEGYPIRYMGDVIQQQPSSPNSWPETSNSWRDRHRKSFRCGAGALGERRQAA